MSIFKSSRPSSSNSLRSTYGFYIGSPEAEAEVKSGIQNLEHYFDDFLDVIPNVASGKFIIIGRKGAGKSAIAAYLQNQADKSRNSYCNTIKYNNIRLEDKIHNESTDQVKSTMFFEWIILVRMVKLLVRNDSGVYINEFKKLQDFLKRNTGYVDIDKYQLVELLEKKGGEVKFEVLRHAFGGVINKYFDIKTTTAPFYKLIEPLKQIVRTVLQYQVHKDVDYILLFDDLDIGFKERNEDDINSLVNLLRTARDYNTDVFKGSMAKVLIFLRDDIKTIIINSQADTAKMITSYGITLNWYDHDNFKENENITRLKKFINKRIALNFEANKIEYNNDDPWSSLVSERSEVRYSDKTHFKHILDHTFYRPRDLILFFHPIGTEEYEYPLNSTRINGLIRKMVIELVSELKNELSLTFNESEIKAVMTALQQMANHMTISYRTLLSKFDGLPFTHPVEDVIEILLKYSIIIPKDVQGRMFFNYRERANPDSFHKDAYNYFLHNSIMVYFNS